MESVLRGPRVLLRTLAEEDVDDMMRAVQDPEGRRLTGTHREFTRADVESWCRSRATAPGRYDWAILAADGGGWLGECALNDIDEDNLSGSYRIALDVDRAGSGYGTEATGLVLDFAFGELGLHRVELEVFDFNVRAQKSYAKSGFVVEGVKREALRWDGRWHDTVIMAALGIPGAADR
ncbi:MAG: Acetyltransferase [uncultured Corynebacteriales bacterium]|jgi:RimJ/RimL family protein N-acetyltransferase|uniref:Acetyltransferase n=1 Tax=uncultured Mycobacteriales bacterium TaxID=581187 RepID=A0A6J4JDE6_9ACTN|nr:MAG: Acetyltransferase [uncultured Corynebacteriales bacterium]